MNFLEIVLILSAALFVIGFIALIREYVAKKEFTDVMDEIPWGLYIVAYFFFGGVGGGLLVWSAIRGFMTDDGSGLVLAILSLAFFIAAGFSLLLDLGKPSRFWRIFTIKTQSPMFWDFAGLAAGLAGTVGLILFHCGDLVFATNEQLGGSFLQISGWGSMGKFLLFLGANANIGFIVFGIACGMMVFAAECWTLNLCPGKGLWNERSLFFTLLFDGILFAFAFDGLLRLSGSAQSILIPFLVAALLLHILGYGSEHFLPKKKASPQVKTKTIWIAALEIISLVLLMINNYSGTYWLVLIASLLVLTGGVLHKYDQVILPQAAMSYEQWTEYKTPPIYNNQLSKASVCFGLLGLAGIVYFVVVKILAALLSF